MRLQFWNCLWLLLPVLAWNAIFAKRLPQRGFGSDVSAPQVVLAAEHVLRAAIFVWPRFLPLRWGHAQAQAGIILFAIVSLNYSVAWLPLLIYPEAAWSQSAADSLAPAYPPLTK